MDYFQNECQNISLSKGSSLEGLKEVKEYSFSQLVQARFNKEKQRRIDALVEQWIKGTELIPYEHTKEFIKFLFINKQVDMFLDLVKKTAISSEERLSIPLHTLDFKSFTKGQKAKVLEVLQKFDQRRKMQITLEMLDLILGDKKAMREDVSLTKQFLQSLDQSDFKNPEYEMIVAFCNGEVNEIRPNKIYLDVATNEFLISPAVQNYIKDNVEESSKVIIKHFGRDFSKIQFAHRDQYNKMVREKQPSQLYIELAYAYNDLPHLISL